MGMSDKQVKCDDNRVAKEGKTNSVQEKKTTDKCSFMYWLRNL